MKQEIVIEVQMSCKKCRTKAMKIAAIADGVDTVSVQGNEIVLIGDRIDAAELTGALRKKVCQHATLISVQELKPKQPEKKKEPENKKEPEKAVAWTQSYYHQPQHQPQLEMYTVVYDPQPTGCTIM